MRWHHRFSLGGKAFVVEVRVGPVLSGRRATVSHTVYTIHTGGRMPTPRTRKPKSRAAAVSRRAKAAAQQAPAQATRSLPTGRWTVAQFPCGAPARALAELVVEEALHARGRRAPGGVWVAMLGEFFMAEHQPVLLLSPDLADAVLGGLLEFFEMLGPARFQKGEVSRFAFRGEAILWLADDFERVGPASGEG